MVLFLGTAAIFAENLLLTYYLQENLGFSPFEAGLAFLPQTIGAVAAALASGVLMRRLPGRVLIPAGMAMVGIGMFLLGRIETFDGYVAVILPGVILIGAGLGLALSVAVNLGVQGVRNEDAGVASATVNAVQQMGGAIGPALFNTIAGSVLAGYLATRAADDDSVVAAAARNSYSAAFDIAAAVMLAAVIVSAGLLGRLPASRSRGLPHHQQ